MPMRQRIGLSLAMLMISTAAIAGTPKKTGSEPLIQPPAGGTASKSRSARKSAPRRPNLHVSARYIRARPARSPEAAQARAQSALYHPASLRAAGGRQIGEATWYALAGRRTASGEPMDVARATAAHRSLPLLSYARVTNLRNGRSVIVQINDRGPMSHRFVIDLSRRAAEEIGMIRSGVAEVEVQPIAGSAAPSVEQVAAVE